MKTNLNLSRFLRPYFLNYLIGQKNMSPNTIHSYRDTIKILINFLKNIKKLNLRKISIEQITPEIILDFLIYLEQERQNCTQSRNYRLATLHSFFNFVASQEPLLLLQCQKITSIPFKKIAKPPVSYLEKEELDAILETINRRTPWGQRDYALILLMYNSGARVEEISQLTKERLFLSKPYRIEILGKGNIWRTLPLWEITVEHLKEMLLRRKDNCPFLFLNRNGNHLTRFGIYYLVKKYVNKATPKCPSLIQKTISPHTLRHTSAVHLLQSGVDFNTISYWLGHMSLSITHHYARTNFKMLKDVFEQWSLDECNEKKKPSWKVDDSLLEWLESL